MSDYNQKEQALYVSPTRPWNCDRLSTLLFFSLLLITPAEAGRQLTSFNFPSNAKAQQAWMATEGAKNVWVQQNGNALVFPCPFTKNVDRYFWDLTCKLDLSRDSSFLLDVTCDRPEAARTVSIYFKSGTGWYHWSRPIRGPGRQHITILKSECDVEGTPLGWAHIDGIRFSPWKGSSINTDFVLHTLQAQASRLLLVQATSSATTQADRDLSRRATRIISRLLTDSGVEYGTLDDDSVASGSLANADIGVLCYNPNPTWAMLKQLRSFTQAGGKLVVFGSSNPDLANLMGVRLGSFISAERPGRWTAMRFRNSKTRHAPDVVHQIVWGLTPAFPATPSSRVLAHWINARGEVSAEAAWLEGPNGAWMTQIVRDDDMHAKSHMLLSILGHYDNDIWRQAARHRLTEVGRIGRYTDLRDAVRQLRTSKQTKSVQRAITLHRTMLTRFAAQDYPSTVSLAQDLRHLLLTAYGREQKGKANEFRGVWDHDGSGWYPGDWGRTCRYLADAGLNAIFPNVMWAGRAHYKSQYLPGSKTLALFGDQLAQCAASAKKQNIEVHVWKVCWNLANSPPEFVTNLRKEGRLQLGADGTHKDWLCPSHPKNLSHELRTIEEVAQNYDIDGIHLDYIRFPSTSYCFDPTCRRSFEKHIGRVSVGWPKSVQEGGRDMAAFQIWRAEQITSFVRSVRASIRKLNPGIQLSAAVYRRYPSCRDSLGQDWGRWLKEDLVDFVCPMNYTEDSLNFANVTREQLAQPNAQNRIRPGIGVTSSESQLKADQVVDQIQTLRKQGATGFVLFDLGSTLRDDVLPILRLGTTTP